MRLLALKGLPMQNRKENVNFSRDKSPTQLFIYLKFASK